MVSTSRPGPLVAPARGGPPGQRRAAGYWLVSSLTFGPLAAACAAGLARPIPPLIETTRQGLWALGATVVGWLAFTACAYVDRPPASRVGRIAVTAVWAALATLTTFVAGGAEFVLGRLEAQSPVGAMVAIAVVATACFVLAAAGIPRLHPGVNAGPGVRSLPYLGIFGVLAVPVLSDRRDFIANKVDGWAGIGVLAGLLGILLVAAIALTGLAGYVADRRLPARVPNRTALAVYSATAFALALAAGIVMRR